MYLVVLRYRARMVKIKSIDKVINEKALEASRKVDERSIFDMVAEKETWANISKLINNSA